MELKTETEIKILEAAKKVFVEKGFDGTRMQDIANELGMHKALLHYYYRSKEKLFDAVFRDSFARFFPKMSEIMASELSLKAKIESFVENYTNLLIENPHLPLFVFQEIQRSPEKMVELVREFGMKPEYFVNSVQKEIAAGTIRPINPLHLMVNILGMCLFPFIARPVLMGFIFENDRVKIDAFLKERKKEVIEFMMKSL